MDTSDNGSPRFFQTFHVTPMQPKPEYVSAVIDALAAQGLQTPQSIARKTGITRNQVNSILDHLNAVGQLTVVRQSTTPKVRVSLNQNAGARD